jgi:protein-S-isoprenylcysteine O-methyltransferase Ste14
MFRWVALVSVVAVFAISFHYRRLARKAGETIARRREGVILVLLRAVFALPLFAAVLAYLINPAWMAWASFSLPQWLRWLGAVVGLLAIPSAWWLFSHLGSNVSETVLTKSDHSLVTTGPYRWVRHPLYATGGGVLIAVGLMAANWFILGFAIVVVILIRWLVVPLEEEALIAKFGDDYRHYIQRTGGMWPRLNRSKSGSG